MSAVWGEMTHSVRDLDGLMKQIKQLPYQRHHITLQQFVKYCAGIRVAENAGKPWWTRLYMPGCYSITSGQVPTVMSHGLPCCVVDLLDLTSLWLLLCEQVAPWGCTPTKTTLALSET